MKKTFSEFLKESKSDYKIYHQSFTDAVHEIESFVKKKGYSLDQVEMAEKIGYITKTPGSNKTNSYTLTLYKNGKEQKKALHVQVYNRGYNNKEKYELNVYIS